MEVDASKLGSTRLHVNADVESPEYEQKERGLAELELEILQSLLPGTIRGGKKME